MRRQREPVIVQPVQNLRDLIRRGRRMVRSQHKARVVRPAEPADAVQEVFEVPGGSVAMADDHEVHSVRSGARGDLHAREDRDPRALTGAAHHVHPFHGVMVCERDNLDPATCQRLHVEIGERIPIGGLVAEVPPARGLEVPGGRRDLKIAFIPTRRCDHRFRKGYDARDC